MQPRILRKGGALFAILALSMSPVLGQTADAQSRSYRGWATNEGSINYEVEERATTRRGISSSVQRKISNLDKDPAEEIPIPILLGVSTRNITSDFGDPRGGGTREHEGQDIMAPRGAYVVSPTDAVVVRTGTGESAGTYVYTANPGGETYVYMHLDDIAEGIKTGTVLEPGDLIGYVGDTGNALGGVTHLHFEIREGRKALDPYERLKSEFTLEERIEAIEKILDDAKDEEEEAEKLVAAHRGLFVAARAQGIELHDALEEVLGSVEIAGALSTEFVRDLTYGSSGQDVIALQTLLIASQKGSRAVALGGVGATGYFGPMTQAALAEYQAAVGINPTSGYFGPLTRAHLALR